MIWFTEVLRHISEWQIVRSFKKVLWIHLRHVANNHLRISQLLCCDGPKTNHKINRTTMSVSLWPVLTCVAVSVGRVSSQAADWLYAVSQAGSTGRWRCERTRPQCQAVGPQPPSDTCACVLHITRIHRQTDRQTYLRPNLQNVVECYKEIRHTKSLQKKRGFQIILSLQKITKNVRKTYEKTYDRLNMYIRFWHLSKSMISRIPSNIY